ncbi:MAG: hypothetical protein JWM63_5390 [Gammaproteobacteria bacterium]|nr:hypothetical protein [Gammaproteobacteria bacterium]
MTWSGACLLRQQRTGAGSSKVGISRLRQIARVSARFDYLDNLRITEVRAHERLPNRQEDSKHPAIALDRWHVGVEIAAFEPLKPLHVVDQESRYAVVLRFVIAVKATELWVFSKRLRFLLDSLLRFFFEGGEGDQARREA